MSFTWLQWTSPLLTLLGLVWCLTLNPMQIAHDLAVSDAGMPCLLRGDQQQEAHPSLLLTLAMLMQVDGDDKAKLAAGDRVTFTVATRIKSHQDGLAVGGVAAQHAGVPALPALCQVMSRVHYHTQSAESGNQPACMAALTGRPH